MFEGSYHYGVAALANSLHASGFRGNMWVGYRGALPFWARSAKEDMFGRALRLPNGMAVRLVEYDTDVHFSLLKPNFMQRVAEYFDPGIQAIFYFDPDIVVRCPWNFFKNWVQNGIAVCEDTRSPMAQSHPLREAWRKEFGYEYSSPGNRTDMYVNAGFVGVPSISFSVLQRWMDAIRAIMTKHPGGNAIKFGSRYDPFHVPDQDALNVVLYAGSDPVSLAGRDAMDFSPGGYIMSHAVQHPKPWAKRLLWHALCGEPAFPADKEYWRNVVSPIRLYSPMLMRLRKVELGLSILIGRFYRRF